MRIECQTTLAVTTVLGTFPLILNLNFRPHLITCKKAICSKFTKLYQKRTQNRSPAVPLPYATKIYNVDLNQISNHAF